MKKTNNVVPLINKRSAKQSADKKTKKSRRQKLHDAILFALVGGLLLVGFVFVGQAFLAQNEQKQIADRVNVKSDVLSGEKQALAQLEDQASLLKDEDYVAKLARSRYYLSKDGEIIFSLPEDNDSKQAEILNEALKQTENKQDESSQGG